MITLLLKNAFSMIGSSARMPGRSWLTELCVRAAKDVFEKGQDRGLPWLRAAMNKSGGYHPVLSKVSFHQRDIAGVPCTMISPKNGATSDKVVVYFHGGGYVAGSPSSHKTILAQIAFDTQGLVLAPDYRLAPENPFPAPQEDCLAVATLALNTYNDKKITLAGDSAGGALAISTALELSKNNGLENRPDGLVLISPWVDPTATDGSIHRNEHNDFLSRDFLELCFEQLIQDSDDSDPRINFSSVPLVDLPKTLVQYGSGEIFADQIVEFCQRAESEGVEIEVQSYRAQFHVFQLFSAILKDAEVALRQISSFIKR